MVMTNGVHNEDNITTSVIGTCFGHSHEHCTAANIEAKVLGMTDTIVNKGDKTENSGTENRSEIMASGINGTTHLNVEGNSPRILGNNSVIKEPRIKNEDARIDYI